ncbi:helix-turn-helix domain-containing protein [Specibacter cremeus]|uniref:helix-turn-helix domain-containing protein n=1 Tax=Specibacter cremeus TaxID=1629051 RepID=UPI000F772F33|nr:helix-turn-helix domain-containing protein [Specibacter cremeus]
MAAIVSTSDLGKAIRGARIQCGLTQSELARKASVSRKLIGGLEGGKETAELGSALRVAAAIGLAWPSPAPSPQNVLDETAETVQGELARADIDFALRLALDAFQQLRTMKPNALKKPRTTGDARWDALLAAGARIALRGSKAKPRWGTPLPEPWFPAADMRRLSEAYRELTIRRTPKELADFNIFLNDKTLAAA